MFNDFCEYSEFANNVARCSLYAIAACHGVEYGCRVSSLNLFVFLVACKVFTGLCRNTAMFSIAKVYSGLGVFCLAFMNSCWH